ncbi:MAG: type II toxin-antitoxin system HicB family antitoxin, partial [Desulfobacteraceae bacterium]|nr:type II toxin-antitoxin system HicB family antitoxin [Desulfobacteraceae bacterium]
MRRSDANVPFETLCSLFELENDDGKKYEIIIFWSSEDNSFVAEVPELPGCMADGKTYQEALSNAEQIIDEWIETA